MNPNEPLGLPHGSVRAILALLIVLATIAYMFVRGTPSTEMMTLSAMVVTWYFVKRDGDEPAPTEKPLPEPFSGSVDAD